MKWRRGWASDKGVAVAITAALCGIAVHSTVDYFLAYTQFALVLWPLLGVLVGTVAVQDSGAGQNGGPAEEAGG